MKRKIQNGVIDLDSFSLVTVKNPRDPVSEAYKTLRTNIQFSSFDEKIKVIMITSAGPGEGKTFTAANLAVVMAQAGNKTLLIDCDLRKPKIHKIFGLWSTCGVSNLLADVEISEPGIVNSGIENLQILTSGTRPPNPSELLESAKMHQFINSLRNEYDYIILDTPPILIVTDAQIISKYSDGCLLVVTSGETEKESLLKGKEALEKVNSKILGVVLNKMKALSKGYHYYDYDGRKRKREINRVKI